MPTHPWLRFPESPFRTRLQHGGNYGVSQGVGTLDFCHLAEWDTNQRSPWFVEKLSSIPSTPPLVDGDLDTRSGSPSRDGRWRRKDVRVQDTE